MAKKSSNALPARKKRGPEKKSYLPEGRKLLYQGKEEEETEVSAEDNAQ